MYGRPRPATSTVRPSRSSQRGSGIAGSEPATLRDIHVVRAHGADPLELVRELVPRVEQRAPPVW